MKYLHKYCLIFLALKLKYKAGWKWHTKMVKKEINPNTYPTYAQ